MKKILFFILFPFLLTGCQFIGTIYNVGDRVTTILLDNRPLSQDWTDLKTNSKIRKRLISEDPKFGIDLEITVFENTVLLNGALPTADVVDQVLSIVWSVEGVEHVINYIRISEQPSLIRTNEDAAVSAKIRTHLSLTRHVHSSNYKITMENGIVYLMGITQDDAELERVVSVIKNTPSVEKFIILTRYKDAPQTTFSE